MPVPVSQGAAFVKMSSYGEAQAAIAALEKAEDSVFEQQNPNEGMRQKFATIGAMHGFYVGGQFMMHMGQMSAWRRMAGFGPA